MVLPKLSPTFAGNMYSPHSSLFCCTLEKMPHMCILQDPGMKIALHLLLHYGAFHSDFFFSQFMLFFFAISVCLNWIEEQHIKELVFIAVYVLSSKEVWEKQSRFQIDMLKQELSEKASCYWIPICIPSLFELVQTKPRCL